MTTTKFRPLCQGTPIPRRPYVVWSVTDQLNKENSPQSSHGNIQITRSDGIGFEG